MRPIHAVREINQKLIPEKSFDMTIRKTQRVPKSCYQCYTSKIKCNMRIPCDRCASRGIADQCFKERVSVHGKVFNSQLNEVEVLRQENMILRQKLQKVDSERQESVVARKSFDLYGTGIHILLRNLVQNDDTTPSASYHDFEALHYAIDQRMSNLLVQFHLDHYIFLHCAIHPDSFLREHEGFWDASDSHHLDLDTERSTEEYLWMSLWYAVLSSSLYMLSEELRIETGLLPDKCFELAKLTVAASLECLSRGKYLSSPNTRTVQCFCVLASCFHGFAGVHLQNSLLASIIYIAETLNLNHLDDPSKLPALDFEIGCRVWWVLVIIDWLESYGRRRIITPMHFTSNIPRNIPDDQLTDFHPKETESCENITYNRIMLELAVFKNKLYYDNEIDTSAMNVADLETALIGISDIYNRARNMYPTIIGSAKLKLQRFLIDLKFNYELLGLHRTALSLKTRDQWLIENRPRLIDHAITLLNLCSNLEVPFHYKKYWFTPEYSITASTILLLDQLAMSDSNSTWMQMIKDQIPLLESLKSTHLAAGAGLPLIDLLMGLVKAKKGESDLDSGNLMNNMVGDLKSLPRIYSSAGSYYDILAGETLFDFLKDDEWSSVLDSSSHEN